jgi:hypothetical protein
MPGLRMPANHDAEALALDPRDGVGQQRKPLRVRPAGAVEHQLRLHREADEGETGPPQFGERSVVDIGLELRVILARRVAEPVGEVDAARERGEVLRRHIRARRGRRQRQREGKQLGGDAPPHRRYGHADRSVRNRKGTEQGRSLSQPDNMSGRDTVR